MPTWYPISHIDTCGNCTWWFEVNNLLVGVQPALSRAPSALARVAPSRISYIPTCRQQWAQFLFRPACTGMYARHVAATQTRRRHGRRARAGGTRSAPYCGPPLSSTGLIRLYYTWCVVAAKLPCTTVSWPFARSLKSISACLAHNVSSVASVVTARSGDASRGSDAEGQPLVVPVLLLAVLQGAAARRREENPVQAACLGQSRRQPAGPWSCGGSARPARACGRTAGSAGGPRLSRLLLGGMGGLGT